MASFTLKTNAIRVNTIIGTLFSDMTSAASQYTVPFGRIGGVFMRVLLQIRLGIQKAVTVAVRVALASIRYVSKTNEWYGRRETVYRNTWSKKDETGPRDRWVKTTDGEDERWQ